MVEEIAHSERVEYTSRESTRGLTYSRLLHPFRSGRSYVTHSVKSGMLGKPLLYHLATSAHYQFQLQDKLNPAYIAFWQGWTAATLHRPDGIHLRYVHGMISSGVKSSGAPHLGWLFGNLKLLVAIMQNDDEIRRILSELPTPKLRDHLYRIAKSLPFYLVLAGAEDAVRLALRGPRLNGKRIAPAYPGDEDWSLVVPEVVGVYRTISEFRTLNFLREMVPEYESIVAEYGIPEEDRNLLANLGMSRSRVDELSLEVRGSDVEASEELLTSRLNEDLTSDETQLIEAAKKEPGYSLFSRIRRVIPAPLASVLAFRLRRPKRETVRKASSIVKIGAGGGAIVFDVSLSVLGGPLTIVASAFGGAGAIADGVKGLAAEKR